MDIRKVGRRFYQTYTKENGGKFKGLLGRPSLTARYTDYTITGMVLFTAPDTNLNTGDVFFSKFNRAMICLDNADEESLGRTQRCFTVKPTNAHLSWKRPIKTVNKITGLEESKGFEDLGMLYCSLEEQGINTSTLNIPFPKYKIITNKPLRLNDVIDDKYVVTKVDNFLGVIIADVKQS